MLDQATTSFTEKRISENVQLILKLSSCISCTVYKKHALYQSKGWFVKKPVPFETLPLGTKWFNTVHGLQESYCFFADPHLLCCDTHAPGVADPL